MKIAIISDIHGNLDAIDAVLKEIKKKGIKKIYNLGDIMGYYYKSNECINLLRKNKVKSVFGNHEKIYFKSKKNKKYLNLIKKKYGRGLDISSKKISKNNFKWLSKLPKKITIKTYKKFLFCHGSPYSENDYIYKNKIKDFKKIFSKIKYDYVFVGNTHIQMRKKIKNTIIINPGSVGQPRERGVKGAQWCIFDINRFRCRVFFKETIYEKKNLLNMIKKNDPTNYFLKNVLIR